MSALPLKGPRAFPLLPLLFVFLVQPHHLSLAWSPIPSHAPYSSFQKAPLKTDSGPTPPLLTPLQGSHLPGTRAPVLLAAHKALHDLPRPLLALTPCSLCSHHRASSLFLQHASLDPVPGPLHGRCALPRTLAPIYVVCFLSSSEFC